MSNLNAVYDDNRDDKANKNNTFLPKHRSPHWLLIIYLLPRWILLLELRWRLLSFFTHSYA